MTHQHNTGHTGRTWQSIDDWLTQRQIHAEHTLQEEVTQQRRAGNLIGTALAEARLDDESMDWTPRTSGTTAKVIPLQQRGALVRRHHPDVIA